MDRIWRIFVEFGQFILELFVTSFYCPQRYPDTLVSLSPSRSIRDLRQRMSAVADFIPNDVTNLRDVIDVPVPVIDVGDSSLRVQTVELSGLLSRNSAMIPVAPATLLVLENVPVVGESMIPIIDSDRIPTAGKLNSSDSVSCNIMALV